MIVGLSLMIRFIIVVILYANGGHKISAITRMGISPDDILSVVG